jgi:hypothetical protein
MISTEGRRLRRAGRFGGTHLGKTALTFGGKFFNPGPPQRLRQLHFLSADAKIGA